MLDMGLASIGQDCRARQQNVEMAIQGAKPGLWQQNIMEALEDEERWS
jgi:hypothetical protein